VSDDQVEDDEFEDIDQVLFQGPMYGREADLKKHPRLVQAGLIPVKKLITDGLSRRAHLIAVQPKGPRQVVRYTIDGIAYPAGALPGKLGVAVIQMVKLLAGLDVQSRVTKQSGGILAEFDDQQYQLLVETEPVRGAVERLRIRISNVKESYIMPGDIGFPEELRTKIRAMTVLRNAGKRCHVPLDGHDALCRLLPLFGLQRRRFGQPQSDECVRSRRRRRGRP
jgi:hypothetical protein